MDLSENPQVIKLEPPTTPEKANIKERLNLHVKRRLQQEGPGGSAEIPASDVATIEASKRSKAMQPKEMTKTRKPYQKRVEKIKVETGKNKKAQIASPAAELEPLDDGQDGMDASPETPDNKSRDRQKHDILNLVLSIKKRELLQDPEVQAFWSRIMAAIKS